MAKIMFLGPSGSGKTTLARFIEEEFGIPFISGSYSDLVPSTRDVKHVDMLNKSSNQLYSEEHQLLSLRAKEFRDIPEMVSDRSYLDNLSYFIFKLSQGTDQCDTEAFRDNVIQLLDRDCTHIIFIPYTDKMISTWKVEDNHKRVTNIFFQWQISQIMWGLISYFGYKKNIFKKLFFNMNTGNIYPHCATSLDNNCRSTYHKPIKVLILDDSSLEKRKQDIRRFL